MIVKHSQRDIQEEQDKQFSGNDLCDMVGVCGGLRESKSAWSSQAQGRYVSSSVLKNQVAPLQGPDAKRSRDQGGSAGKGTPPIVHPWRLCNVISLTRSCAFCARLEYASSSFPDDPLVILSCTMASSTVSPYYYGH